MPTQQERKTLSEFMLQYFLMIVKGSHPDFAFLLWCSVLDAHVLVYKIKYTHFFSSDRLAHSISIKKS